MATIKDVAKAAGVTVTTVSRVLNNRGYISDGTRRKVQEAMEELHYQPNEIARSLFRKRSNILGLIVPDVSHPFFAELTKHVEYYAYKSSYKVLLCNSYQDSTKEKDYVEMLKRNQVDGIIMGSHTMETSDYLLPSMPIIALDRNLENGIPFVTSDNYEGGRLATRLLIEKVCRRIAHISGPLKLSTPANKRHEAFIKEAQAKGVPYVVKEASLDSFENYESIAVGLFEEHPDIDGIFASSDMIAAAMIKASKMLGKEIPKELKIVGYDDIKLASLMVPELTTIKQPIKQMAEACVNLLQAQIEGKSVSLENILPVTLIERKTT